MFALLFCGESDFVGLVFGDFVLASYCAVELGCLGSFGLFVRER